MRRLLLAIAYWLASWPSWAADPAHLKLFTEEYPPFNMTDGSGRIVGMSTEVVQQLLQRAGIGHDIEMLPWVRAYNRAIQERDSCVYATTRTEQRESQFKWIGPISETTWVLFARSDNARAIHSLEDVRPYRIGGYSGDALAQYLIARNFDVDLARADEQNVRKLLAGRIDYWASGRYSGAILLQREGVRNVRPVLTFNTTFLYLACNPSLSDQTVAKLNDLLARMRKDGTVAKISSRYPID